MKACKTCSHRGNNPFFALFDPGLQYCKRPSADIDPVTGKKKLYSVRTERMFDCGKEGKFHSDNEAPK